VGLLLAVFFVLASADSALALPAFARKYGLRCSACHEAWPELNYFGQKFKDNGYQLMNDRDAPIWQNPAYWPITFRMTPNWHRESTNKITYDTPGGTPGLTRLTYSGFDYGGLDILTAGTLDKNISFQLIPASDETGAFHIEAVNVRLDNLFHSPWLNFKLGKFELDNLVSEKRSLTLSVSGGPYQTYHFIPVGDSNIFGQIGDNQVGVEWMGHSANDRIRLSATVLSSTDGNPDLQYGSETYSAFFTGSYAFNVGKLGILLTFVIAGLAGSGLTFSRLAPSDWVPLPKIIASGMMVFLSYEGFELIANASDRVLNPRRNLPLAYYGSVGTAIVLYFFIIVVTLGYLSFDALNQASNYPLSAAAEVFMGKPGFLLLSVGAILATASAINAGIFGASKLPITLAQMGEAAGIWDREVWQRHPAGLI
jgi:hypothetical protein